MPSTSGVDELLRSAALMLPPRCRVSYGVRCNRSVSVSLMREGPVLCVVCEGTTSRLVLGGDVSLPG